MSAGVKTSQLQVAEALQSIIGNGPNGTAQMELRRFVQQLALDRNLQIALNNELTDGPDLGFLAALDKVAARDIENDAVDVPALSQGVRDILTLAQSAIQSQALQDALTNYVQLQGGKIPAEQLPDAALGAQQYSGLWDADTNTPPIPPAAPANAGFFYDVQVAGTTDIDGTADWDVGDRLISDGVSWRKITNTQSVTSVAGKQGAVALTAEDVGLGNVDPDATENAEDAELRDRSTHTGTQPVSTIEGVTAPGAAILQAQDTASQRSAMELQGYRPASRTGDTTRGTVPGFVVGGQLVVGVDLESNEVVLGPLRLRYDDGELTVLRNGQVAFRLAPDGTVAGIAGSEWIEIGCTKAEIPGRAHSGPVYNVKFNGTIFAYFADGVPFVVVPSNDAVPAHVAQTQEFWIVEWDGQSWVLRNNTVDEVRLTNPAMADRMEAIHNSMVVQPGSDSGPGFNLPFSSTTFPGVMAYQRGHAVDRLSQAWPGNRNHLFRPNEIACAQLDALCRTYGMDRRGLLAWSTGWAGAPFATFLDGLGSGFTYPDGSGGTITVSPQLIGEGTQNAETEYLYNRNLVTRPQIDQVLATRYHNPKASWPFKLWMQWPLEGDGAYQAALDQLRAEDDAIGHKTPDGGSRWIVIDQMAVLHNDIDIGDGLQDQLDWIQATPLGRNVGGPPRYPYALEDGTHHTSEAQVYIAEQYGLAMFDILLRDKHEPLWVSAIDRTQGANVVRYVLNRPAQAVGLPVIDTAFVRDATTGDGRIVSGFSVRNEADNSHLGITGITIGELNSTTCYVDVTLDGPHSGLDIRCKYAGDGVAQVDGNPDPAAYAPTTSGCVGNIKMVGRETGLYSQSPIDQWLWATNQVIEA
ncbi:MAG: hypothetical protein AAFY65_13040 [Pseudomonadota bacterium]